MRFKSFYNQVKTNSLNIWWDHECKRSPDENVHALQSSSIFVCFPSKQYQKSLKNRIEYSIALEQEMKIITLNVDEDEEEEEKKKELGENESRKKAVIKKSTSQVSLSSFFRFIKAETDKLAQKIKCFVQTI